jgi:hypothetical protein
MNTYRKNAMVVGILFIACTAASIAGPLLAGSNLNALDYLNQLAGHPNQTIFAVLLEFIWAATGAGIAIGLYPVLKKYSPGLALGSVGFRVTEGVLVLAGTLSLLGLLSLGQEFIKAGVSAAPAFQTSGTLLVAVRDWAQWTMGPLAFYLGALLYYVVLFQSKLIPRWLSGWGFAGALLGLGTTLFTAFNPGFGSESLHTILNLPIGLQEMFLAVWLIAKGFSPLAIASLSAKTATNKLSNAS